MPVSWIPKVKELQEQIEEEKARLEALNVARELERKPLREAPIINWQPEDETLASPPIPWRPQPTTFEPRILPNTPGAQRQFTQPRRSPWEPMPQARLAPAGQEPSPAVEWWEQPKVWGEEAAMPWVGEQISKVPILPKALEWAAPGFEFIHEKLEKPFASIITAPFSPNLPWRKGESWIEHQKREYQQWQAPTYAKGIAEFAMPLWWMPWLGWAGKGAKALSTGGKMARVMSKLPQAGKVALPSKELLSKTLYKPDFARKVAWWAENKPVLRDVVKAVGGESAFVKAEAATPLEIVRREIVNRAVIYDMRHGAKGLLMPRLQKYGDPTKVLNIEADGLVRTAIPTVKGASRYLYDVLENPTNYRFTSAQAKAYVKELRDIIGEVRGLAVNEGIKVPKELVVHRIVKGKIGTKGTYETSEFGSLFEVARHHKTMAEGVKAGVQYGINPNESVASTINHYIRRIATKRFDDEVGKLGKTPLEKFAAQFPAEAEKIADLTARASAANYAVKTITTIFSRKGITLPSAVMAKIRRGLPEVADGLADAFAISPQVADRLISGMSKDILKVIKMSPREFKVAVASFEGRTLLEKMGNAILAQNVSNKVAVKSVEKLYQTVYKSNKEVIDNTLKAVRNEARRMLDTAKGELTPLTGARKEFLARYRGGKQVLGEFESYFNRHPAFRGKLFDTDVVRMAEKALYPQANSWLRGMSAVSGTSRMLTAALDFSAPFIQGLAVLGRNPLAWIKAVGKQFEFFTNPKNLYKYMSDPVNLAVRAERIAYGGSSQTWEFFEALAPLQRTMGKVPVAGKVGKGVIGQSYGRAEAAFTGFGECARNEMWKALRRPNMSEPQLRELARTVDRMTGVMSSEALAIGLTQRELENAFVFFAPRYTRASLAYVGDVFKGGLTGAETRKSLGALMASGLAMYYGASTALSQQPNLDPRSARFLTIKVGEHHLGIGGILYSLMRLGSGVATTAAEEPLDLVRLSRFDNPFIRFMYSRTAPLTGLSVGLAIEQKNFFGEPFESAADYGKFMADKVIPIAMQDIVPWEDQKITAPVFASEIMGGRTFPKSPWEQREEARDRIAAEQYGKTYTELPELYKREVDKLPEIGMLAEEADIRTIQRGEALSVAFLNRQGERDDARAMYVQDLWQLQEAYDAGMIDGYDFRELMQLSGNGLGTTYRHIDQRYPKVIKKLQEPRDISKEYVGDIAYDELMEASYSGQFESEYGIFQYDAYSEFREQLRRKYGEDVWSYVLEREAQRREEMPPLAQQYYEAREILRPYWQVRDQIEKLFGKAFAESSRGQAFISKQRKMKRLTNPDIMRAHALFYARG